MVFLLVPRADTSTVWSRCVSLTCLESGVAHILSVAVADRFSILVADQGQMLDIERRTYTASSKIWMEQLTCSLLSCHCEARNQWLVAWDKSNWQLQKWAQQHWLSAIEGNFLRNDAKRIRLCCVLGWWKESLWFHARDVGHRNEDLQGLQQDLNGENQVLLIADLTFGQSHILPVGRRPPCSGTFAFLGSRTGFYPSDGCECWSCKSKVPNVSSKLFWLLGPIVAQIATPKAAVQHLQSCCRCISSSVMNRLGQRKLFSTHDAA